MGRKYPETPSVMLINKSPISNKIFQFCSLRVRTTIALIIVLFYSVFLCGPTLYRFLKNLSRNRIHVFSGYFATMLHFSDTTNEFKLLKTIFLFGYDYYLKHLVILRIYIPVFVATYSLLSIIKIYIFDEIMRLFVISGLQESSRSPTEESELRLRKELRIRHTLICLLPVVIWYILKRTPPLRMEDVMEEEEEEEEEDMQGQEPDRRRTGSRGRDSELGVSYLPWVGERISHLKGRMFFGVVLVLSVSLANLYILSGISHLKGRMFFGVVLVLSVSLAD